MDSKGANQKGRLSCSSVAYTSPANGASRKYYRLYRIRRNHFYGRKISAVARRIAREDWRLEDGSVRADEKVWQHALSRALCALVLNESFAREQQFDGKRLCAVDEAIAGVRTVFIAM